MLLPTPYLAGFLPWGGDLSEEARRALPQWNILQWDGLAEFYPWRLHAARSLAQGQVPLWNPAILWGTPFLANSQSAPLYPLHWLYALPLGVDVSTRMGWVAFLHLSLAGGFAAALARDLGARPVAAALAGAAYELSGFAVAWLELPSFITVGCWVPAVMLAMRRAAREGTAGPAAAAGAAIGLMLLAGHLQIAFYGLLGGAAAWLSGAAAHFPEADRRARLLRAAACGAGSLALGLALAAPQVLPSMELSRMSHRVGRPTEAGYAAYVDRALPASNAVTLLAPDFYGLPARGDFWGWWEYGAPNVLEYAGHVGAAALLLAVIGLLWGRRVSAAGWGLGLGLALLSLLLATGSPLCRLFYFAVPGFAQSGSPARALALFCLAQALLAALGGEWLLRRAEERWTACLAPLGAGLAGTLLLLALLVGLALAFPQTERGASLDELLRQTAYPAAMRAAVYAVASAFVLALLAWLLRDNSLPQREATVGLAGLALVTGGLALLGGAYNLTGPRGSAFPPHPVAEALARSGARVGTLNREWQILEQSPALFPPNASLVYGWRDLQGYDSLYLGRPRRLLDALAVPERDASPESNANVAFLKHAAAALLPLASARYLVSRAPLSRDGLRPAAGFPPGPPHVYEDLHALPEAYVVGEWFTAEDAEGLRRLAALPRERLARTALVAPEADLSPPVPAVGGVPPGVRLDRPRPGELRVALSGPSAGLLVVSESYAPGWRAVVRDASGRERAVPVRRVNVALMGVALEPGDRDVTLQYRPGSFQVGLFLSLLALAALAMAGLAAPRGRAGA